MLGKNNTNEYEENFSNGNNSQGVNYDNHTIMNQGVQYNSPVEMGMNNFNMPQQNNSNPYYNYGAQQVMGNYYLNNNKGYNQQQGKFNPNFKNNNESRYNPKYKNYQNSNYRNNNLNNLNTTNTSDISTENDEFNVLQSLKYVSDKYSSLVSLNNNNIGITENVKAQASPRFFVIKSFTEEDIHKSIKFGCWSSTKEGNKKLNIALEDCMSHNSDLYLFFSMNGSGRFVGFAKMSGKVDEKAFFEYWAMDEVWRGLMPVEWCIVKDIPNKFLKDIRLSNNAFKPVTNSRDTQEIPRAEGEQMMGIFEDFMYQTSILQHFQYYDERQDLFEKARKSQKQF